VFFSADTKKEIAANWTPADFVGIAVL